MAVTVHHDAQTAACIMQQKALLLKMQPALQLRSCGPLDPANAFCDSSLQSAVSMISRPLLCAACSEWVGEHVLRTRTPFQAGLLAELMSKVRPGSVVVDAGETHGRVVSALGTCFSGISSAFMCTQYSFAWFDQGARPTSLRQPSTRG